jgi:hypothetical protein
MSAKLHIFLFVICQFIFLLPLTFLTLFWEKVVVTIQVDIVLLLILGVLIGAFPYIIFRYCLYAECPQCSSKLLFSSDNEGRFSYKCKKCEYFWETWFRSG